MQIIKKQYLNPVPILFTARGIPEVSLISNDFNSAKGIQLSKHMNEVSSLSFEIPYNEDRKLDYDSCEKLVKFENEYYIIKNAVIDTSSQIIKVECQHESTELKGVYCSCIDLIGVSPKEMFDKIVETASYPMKGDYNWKGTDVPDKKFRHLQTEDEQSVYANLVSMAEVFNGWLEFTTDEEGKKWIYLRTQEIDNNKFISKDIDLLSLNVTYRSDEIFTRLTPFGSADSITGNELTIMEVNPTKKSYIENYSYYLAKGITMEQIEKEAKYQQMKVLREDKYTEAKDLYDFAMEELEKYCYPQIEANISMEDLSVYMDSIDEPPVIGNKITVVDRTTGFVLGCKVTDIIRDYDKPAETNISISNFVRYDTVFENLQHTATTVDRVTSTDSEGTPIVPETSVKDSNGVNMAVKLGDMQTSIEMTEERITARVDNLEEETYSQIEMLDESISMKVGKGEEFSTEFRQSSEDFKYLFGDVTSDIVTIDNKGILCENEDGSYTRLGSKGIQHLSSANSRNGKPYHYLTASGSMVINCENGSDDYTEGYDSLPADFEGIDDENIAISVAIQKVYKDGSYIPFWFGAYGSIENGEVRIRAMSSWLPWNGGSTVNGKIIVSWVAIA